MALPRLEPLLEPAYIEGLQELPIEEVRKRRAECQEVEVALSYLRRLAQGRLDIVLAELARRAGGGDAGDVHSLVDNLPEILSDHVRAPGIGRLPQFMAPSDGQMDAELMSELDEAVEPSRLTSLPTLADDEVRAIADRLGEIERDVSHRRRALHDRIDALQEEIVRRYRTGEATVESLLR